MGFRVGQEVVCVNADHGLISVPWAVLGGLDGLTKGQTYVVRSTGNFRGFPCIWLNEIVRAIRGDDPNECGFSVLRFAPAVKRKTDTGMAILKKVAADQSKKRVLVIAND